jgi:hypothetical protein
MPEGDGAGEVLPAGWLLPPQPASVATSPMNAVAAASTVRHRQLGWDDVGLMVSSALGSELGSEVFYETSGDTAVSAGVTAVSPGLRHPGLMIEGQRRTDRSCRR